MHILTFDIEDWFHIEFEGGIKYWNNYESRLEQNVERIFNLLLKYNQPATFFCLGWIAEKYPHVIKKIDNLGYEIGSHSYDHKLIFKKSKEEFEEDLKRSLFSLEDIIGKKIKYFRAPAFSINKDTLWFFEIIHKYGIEIDGSIFPDTRDFGGFPGFSPARPVKIIYKGIELKEFPINLHYLFGKKIVFSGGGYFRLLPYFVIKNFAKSTNYMMTYIHPRDLDSEQPKLDGLSIARQFKSYVGLKKSIKKFEHFLADFNFVDLKAADELIDWNKSDVINL